MAKSLIDEIRSCESEAEKIVLSAEKEAEEIINKAKENGENLKEETKRLAKKEADSIKATADNNAFKVKTKAFAKNDESVKELKEEAEKNLNKACDVIIKEIIPE